MKSDLVAGVINKVVAPNKGLKLKSLSPLNLQVPENPKLQALASETRGPGPRRAREESSWARTGVAEGRTGVQTIMQCNVVLEGGSVVWYFFKVQVLHRFYFIMLWLCFL